MPFVQVWLYDGVYIFTTPFMVVILKEKQVVVTGGEEC